MDGAALGVGEVEEMGAADGQACAGDAVEEAVDSVVVVVVVVAVVAVEGDAGDAPAAAAVA
jgi:hypothetical protein